jgi:hypothetical protein
VTANSTVVDGPSVSALTASGVLSFADVDQFDFHTLAVTASPHDLGTLTATLSHDTAGDGTTGIINWSYQVAESAVHALNTPVTTCSPSPWTMVMAARRAHRSTSTWCHTIGTWCS